MEKRTSLKSDIVKIMMKAGIGIAGLLIAVFSTDYLVCAQHNLNCETAIFMSEAAGSSILFYHSADRLNADSRSFPFGRMEEMVLLFDIPVKVILYFY